jgi:hypothetical protein
MGFQLLSFPKLTFSNNLYKTKYISISDGCIDSGNAILSIIGSKQTVFITNAYKEAVLMKSSFFIAMVIVLSFSISGLCSDTYIDANQHIGNWNTIMKEYINKLKNLEDLSSVAMTCEAFATKIESITPAIKEVREKYPELSSENPPDEMKSLMDENKDLTRKLNNKLTELMKFANKHSDDQSFQNAFGKLNMAVYKMKR